MIECTLGDIRRMSNGKLNKEEYKDIKIKGVSIDTRTINKKNLFVPIIGEKLDGHRFISQAFNKGAVASIIDITHEMPLLDKPYVIVDDSTAAYKNLATNYRESLKDITIIGITGSNGKTSIKDILASVLRKQFNTKKTVGNLNNQIGVPKTLLTLSKNTKFGIIEMGTDGFGQISNLTKMAKPHIAIISNIGDSHLQDLGTKDNIARAKFEILEGLDESGVFIYNSDDEVLNKIIKEYDIKQKVITFGFNKDADYRLEILNSNITGSEFLCNGEKFRVNLMGEFQVHNAAPAIIIAKHYGLTNEEINEGLMVQDRSAMRNELIECDGFDILNDSYKSNPQSLKEAFNTMSLLTGYSKKIAIIGDMLELGENEKELHKEAGRNIDPKAVDYLLLLGDLSNYTLEGALENFPRNRVYHFTSKEDLVDEAKYLITKGTLALVKGSRGLRMEEIVESLKDITL